MNAEAWRQAKGVLAEALLCPTGEREALVLERCADPSLRREVQACLNQYDDRFLESALTISGTFESTNAAAAVEAEQLPDIHPGDYIGPYVVLSRLGVGGMGHVFLGSDTRLQRKVALKCLIASASAVDLRSRILHEARAAARISHPNIAIVHDVVEHEGRPFLVMEYIEGESLAAVIRRERLPLDRILVIGRQLASALAAAHGRGIIHRDLKPANIQVMPDGSVKILDFGVAQAMSMAAEHTDSTTAVALPVSTTATLRTEHGAIRHPGTPAYMSPEQMFGRPIDQRSDIYSLGIILYEMSTGHRPYSTDDPLEVVLALSGNVLRPTAESNLPTGISGVIDKMLAVNVHERYQSAAEVETALDALTKPEPLPVPASASRSAVRIALRAAGAALVVSGGVMALGFVQTAAFNRTLDRVEPFNQESPLVWMQFGLRGLLLPTVFLIGIAIVVLAVRFMIRVLSLSKRIEHLVTVGATHTAHLGIRLGLDDPFVMGQAVAGVGLLVLAAIGWRFYPFLRAFMTWSINTKPNELFWPLRPTGQPKIDAQLYVFLMSILIFAFSAAIARIRRLRAAQAIRTHGAPFAVVVGMLAVVILLCEAPIRIEWHNEMERVVVDGKRCYVIGEHGDDQLIYCPDQVPPRNRIVKRSDPNVRDLGVRESIFTPPETSH